MATPQRQNSEDIPLPLVSADLTFHLIETLIENVKCKREHMMNKMQHVYMMVETCDKILARGGGDAELTRNMRSLQDRLSKLHPWTRKTFEVWWKLSREERSRLSKPAIPPMRQRLRSYVRRKNPVQANGAVPIPQNPPSNDVKILATKLYVLSSMLDTLPQKHSGSFREIPKIEISRLLPGYTQHGIAHLSTSAVPENFKLGIEWRGLQNNDEQDRIVREMLEHCFADSERLKILLFQLATQSSAMTNALTCYAECPIRRPSYLNVTLEGKWGYILSGNPPRSVCQVSVADGDLSATCWLVLEFNQSSVFLTGD